MPDDPVAPRSIFFFANGTAAVCDGQGEQMGRYQAGWHGTTIEALAADGIDWRTIPDRNGSPLDQPPDWWLSRQVEARLRSIIERARESLIGVDVTVLEFAALEIETKPLFGFNQIARCNLGASIRSIVEARRILREADPESTDG
jgi:hypothetical protein